MFIAKRSLPRKMYNIQVPAFNIIESGNIVLVAQPVDNVLSYKLNYSVNSKPFTVMKRHLPTFVPASDT